MSKEEFLKVTNVTYTTEDGTEYEMKGVAGITFKSHGKLKGALKLTVKYLAYMIIWILCCLIADFVIPADISRCWIMILGYFAGTIGTRLGMKYSGLG